MLSTPTHHPHLYCLPLPGLRERYEAHHKLRYTDEALMAAAKMSSQYISDRFLPDKVREEEEEVCVCVCV